jgi:tetratricopeptide (TPR) repeat protein
MARARHLRPRGLSELDELRSDLARLERTLPTIEGTGRKAVELLSRLDTAHDRMASLREQGPEPGAERARLESIDAMVRGRRATVLVREIKAAGGWKAARTSAEPDRDRWWWYLDEEVGRRRRAGLRQWLSRGLVAFVVLGLVAGAYQRFLAPSPEAERKIATVQRAERAYAEGDLAQAIASYELAAALEASDPETQLRLGILYNQVGRRDDALSAFRSARELSPFMSDYFLMRGRAYLDMGLFGEAGQDILAALSLDPDSTEALLFLADLLERQGNTAVAMALFQHISLEAEDPSLQLLAKMRYGMLLQSGPSIQLGALPSGIAPAGG